MEQGFWQSLYEKGETRFDLGGPSAPLVDWLDAQAGAPPGRAIVPGCGRGHDAIELAGRGWTALGVDFAPSAVADARLYALAAGMQDRASFLQADIFALGPEHDAAYDLLFEQTCYCAIDPSRRDDYVKLVSRIVKPGGVLLFVVFPSDGRQGGPPFNIGRQEVPLRFAGAFELVSQAEPARPSAAARAGKELFAVLRRKA